MDRYSPRLLRGVAAAGVSIFLVAGAAFAANAVMGAPHSTSRNFVPAAATSQSDASKVEATETAEPTETPDATTGTAKPGAKAEGTEKAEPTRSPRATGTAEPTETPEVEDQSGDNNEQGRDNDGDEHAGARATPTAGAPTSGSAATPEPTHSHGGHGSDNGGHGSDNSDNG